MIADVDSFVLEEIITRNRLDARWFLPFTIYRLQPFAVNHTVTFNVTLYHVLSQPVVQRQLQLTWSRSSERITTPPVQEHIVTEWAACGLACALIPLYTGLQVLQVTQIGERFDYWVGNETQEFGLEISGVLTGENDQRHRAKLRQLMDNPHKVAGYVCITSFHVLRAILSFHHI